MSHSVFCRNEEGEENLRKRTMMLPFSFTTGEAVLYDTNLPRSRGNNIPSDTTALDDCTQARTTGTVDPHSLLGSMLKQDESIYVCPVDERSVSVQGLENKHLGGIFSSNWQESALSLSESSLFKQEPVVNSGGDDSCEILNFMGSLGIRPEDLEFLQDELLLRIDLGGQNDVADLTDGILSCVQHSLRTKTDCIMSGDSLKEKELVGKPIQTFTPQQRASTLLLQDSCDPLAKVSQQQQITFTTKPPEPNTQHFIQMQSHSELQAIPDLQSDPHGHQHIRSQPNKGTGITPCELSHITSQKHQVQTMSQQSQCSYLPPLHLLECKILKNAQICGNFPEILVSDTQQVPPLFQPELQQPGCFYLESPLLDLKHPYRNHLSMVSFSCSQQHSSPYITAGDTGMSEFTAQDLEVLLCGLDGDVERNRHSGQKRGVGIESSLNQQDYIGQVRTNQIWGSPTFTL